MSNKDNKVNWEVIEKYKQQEEFKCIWNPYGLPEITDPTETVYGIGVDVQPAWKIPEKIAVSTTIVGSFYSKKGNPNHPTTIKEIYNSACEVCLAGAPIVHIHVRKDGYNVLDYDSFHEVIDPLRKEFPDVWFDGCMVPVSGNDEWETMVKLLKEGLLDSTPINTTATYCGDSLFAKPPHVMIEKTRICQEFGVVPQIAVYCDGDIDNADRYLIKTGLLEKPYHFLILPALPGGSPMPSAKGMVDSLTHMSNRIMEIDPGTVLMVCAAGRASSYLATMAALLGYNIRVGMEDTVWKWPHKNDKIENNAEHFRNFKQLLGLLGREVATADEYRAMLGIPPKK
ncbi:MAG TPA: 3-keto-5-aminohexanoate cleavage protein [Anaerovoracaceae bacterium]|nr:3-keto-5-aminohexanoate cleavage protein [Anaerovoracaceae bacterium]